MRESISAMRVSTANDPQRTTCPLSPRLKAPLHQLPHNRLEFHGDYSFLLVDEQRLAALLRQSSLDFFACAQRKGHLCLQMAPMSISPMSSDLHHHNLPRTIRRPYAVRPTRSSHGRGEPSPLPSAGKADIVPGNNYQLRGGCGR